MAKDNQRTFTVQGSDIGADGGLYKSSTPGAAAKKAARMLIRKGTKGSKAPKSVKFVLRETTRESNKKLFAYEGLVHVFDEPRVIKRKDVEIEVTKEVKVKALKDKPKATLMRSLGLTDA